LILASAIDTIYSVFALHITVALTRVGRVYFGALGQEIDALGAKGISSGGDIWRLKWLKVTPFQSGIWFLSQSAPHERVGNGIIAL
jgi:hypothetical protein